MPVPNSGFLVTLPADVLLDTGVLYLNSDTPFGVSDGGIAFDPGVQRENVEFDGKFAPVEGLDRTISATPKISGKLIEASDTKLEKLEAGSTNAVVSGVTTITPLGMGELYAAGTYITGTGARVAYRRGGGGFAIVKFPIALITVWKVGPGGANKRAQIDFEIEARQDSAAANTGVVPYVIVLAPAIAGA